MRDCTKAIELNPKNSEAYYERGVSYKQKGQMDLAKKDFDKAIELDPKIAEREH